MAYARGFFVLSALLICTDTPAFAHGGGVNAEGCHNNRKTGDYHCHPPKRAAVKKRARQSQLSPRPESRSNGEVRFSKCAEAHSAGRSNIKRGEPGYRAALDRDRDGIACER